jgi:polyisoprenoid-binding protein YceI
MMKIMNIFMAIALLNTFARAQDKPLIKVYCDKKLSTISYSMHHPLHSWTGVSKDITSIIVTDENRIQVNNVAVVVKISSFDSQNANRDSHLMEVTEALKYPTVSFTSNSIKQEGNKLIVSGTLIFHGVSQLISFDAEKKINNNKAEITGGFTVNMTQFNIDPPSLLGIATDDDIEVTFKTIY